MCQKQYHMQSQDSNFCNQTYVQIAVRPFSCLFLFWFYPQSIYFHKEYYTLNRVKETALTSNQIKK